MSDQYFLACTPEEITKSLLERFNSGKVEAMMGLYGHGAIFVTDSGDILADPKEIAAALANFLALELPMKAIARHIFVSDDIAEIVLDWSIDGDGVHLEGTACDIARRGSDGYWRYIIDNPYGTAVRAAA
ncbi:YybH family protein [Nocardia gamkensis]|uniref:YybH family protein n=1 Tax=Nocardia gamkensis TaxID=352869 RepID=UPI0037C7C212